MTVEAVPGPKVVGKVERIAPGGDQEQHQGISRAGAAERRGQAGASGHDRQHLHPVASADDVVAAPLAAVFTEFNPRPKQVERYAWVQQGASGSAGRSESGSATIFLLRSPAVWNPGTWCRWRTSPAAGWSARRAAVSGAKSGGSSVTHIHGPPRQPRRARSPRPADSADLQPSCRGPAGTAQRQQDLPP